MNRTFGTLAMLLGLGSFALGLAQSGGVSSLLTDGAKFEKVADGFTLAEGPLWFEGRLLVSDVGGNAVYAIGTDGKKTVVQQPSNWANGHTLDREGRIVQAEHGRRVVRLEKDGKETVLAERFDGKRLNSPNDVVVHSSGAIYFSDPPFGLQGYGPGGSSELGFNGVYRLKDGQLELLNRNMGQPNGLAFSADEKTLYVSDSSSGRITAFAVAADGKLGAGRNFGAGGDGLRVDAEGRVWATQGSGPTITVTDAGGKQLGTLTAPEGVTNLTWGGPSGRTLFVTTWSGVYKLETRTTLAGR